MATFEQEVISELQRHANNVSFLKKNLQRLLDEWNYTFGLWNFCPNDEDAVKLCSRLTDLEKKIASNAKRLEACIRK